MLQDPNVERYVEEAITPLQKQITEMKAQIKELMLAKNIVVQANVSRRENRCDGCGCRIDHDKIICHKCSIPKY